MPLVSATVAAAGGCDSACVKIQQAHCASLSLSGDWHFMLGGARGSTRRKGSQGARRAQLPAFTAVHTLSASRERITAAAFSARGDWLALGCAALGQLLVWEWRSERYVLRQQARPLVQDLHANCGCASAGPAAGLGAAQQARRAAPAGAPLCGCRCSSCKRWLERAPAWLRNGGKRTLASSGCHHTGQQECSKRCSQDSRHSACRCRGPLEAVASGCASLVPLACMPRSLHLLRAATRFPSTGGRSAQGHAHDVATAAFSPDGATIATGADDNKVRARGQRARAGPEAPNTAVLRG